MASNYEMIGAIKTILDPQTFASGFVKREFVLVTEEEYPQSVKFECVKQQCALLDSVKSEDRVRVQFRVRGNEYKERFYVNLQALQIEKMGADGASVTMEPEAPPDDGPIPF